MGREHAPVIPADKTGEEQRFEEIYRQEVRLPEELEGSVTIFSCLSWREEQQVYLVRDDRGRFSILKRAKGPAAALLLGEADNLREFRFSFLPQCIFASGNEEESWVQREYIPGDTLWDMVERGGPLSEKEAGELLCRLCELTGQLHSAQPPVICRDIKPQNLVITPEGNLFLIDFGTAREYREEAAFDTVFMGTRQTAAPEQYGYRQTDCRTDIYALGMVYLYLLTGSLDVQKHSVKSLLSPAAREIIEKCTRLAPEERYQNCRELKAEILEAAGHVTERSRKRKQRKWKILAAGLVCAAAVSGGFMYAAEQNKPYRFHSEMIEMAVRLQLGKEAGEPVKREELAQIEMLRICGNRVLGEENHHFVMGSNHFIDQDGDNETMGTITDLTDCSYMTNLHTLVADQQQITDISPLEKLPLENLSLCCNPITDLSPLQNMESLETLYVDETNISDLSALKEKVHLRELGIKDTQITDMQPLEGLGIEKLFMAVPSENDQDVIAGLPLKKLMLQSYSPELEEAIGTITTLEELTVYNYVSTTLTPLLGLENLTSLDLFGGNVESLEGIGQLKELDYLMVSHTQVADLIPLEENQKLNWLLVDGAPVADFSPLLKLPSLQGLGCSQSQKEALDRVIEEPQFEITVYEDDPSE